MGIFNSVIGGSRNRNLGSDDGQGELYEVRTTLGTADKPDERMSKVASLLTTWYREYEQYSDRKSAPTFALELHGLYDDTTDRKVISTNPLDDDVVLDNPMDGYGAYVFIPESTRQSTVSVIGNIYASPIDIPDDFDVLKVLAKTYIGEYDERETPPVFTRELVTQRPEYYPLTSWGSKDPADPMNEIFSVFERLKKGQFAGISIPCRMADSSPTGWKGEANKRIREIQDPYYIAHPSLWDRARNLMRDDPEHKYQMGGRVDRLAGYETQTLDVNEKNEIQAIQDKMMQNAFRCVIRVYASQEEIADALCTVLLQRTSGLYNTLRVASTRCSLDDLARRTIGRNSFVMSSEELSSIWHVPDDGNSAFNRLHKAQPQISTPPESLVIIPSGGDGDIKALLKAYLTPQIETGRGNANGKLGR